LHQKFKMTYHIVRKGKAHCGYAKVPNKSQIKLQMLAKLASLLFLITSMFGCSSPTETFGTSNQVADVPEELISFEDTSVTEDAVARGEDPEFELLRTRFFCYYKADQNGVPQTGFSTPHGTVDFEETTYNFVSELYDNDTGSLIDDEDFSNQLYLNPSSGGQVSLRISHDIFGQRLEGSSDSNFAGCYQTGASHKRALHQFLLNTPEPGLFSCVVGENNSIIEQDRPLTLLDGNQYSYNDLTGTYRYEEIFTGASSTIIFNTGPLAQWEGEYGENPNTGVREISIARLSSNTGAICTKRQQPRPFKRYGSKIVTAPPVSSTPLTGTYYLDNGDINSVGWVEITANGFINFELPIPGVTNCRRTLPNGLEPCTKYIYNGGSTVTFIKGTLQRDLPISVNTDGVISLADVARYIPVTTPSINELVGSWTIESATTQSSVDTSLCILGYCNASTSSLTYEFFADGRFANSSASSGLTTVNVPGVSVFASQDSQTSQQGTFELSGAILQIQYDSGTTDPPTYMHLYDRDTLIIGYRVFRRGG